MRPSREYQTVKASTSELLDQQVQRLLEAGWKLAGGGYYASSSGFYCQAMTLNA